MAEKRRYEYPLQLPESLKETETHLAKEGGASLNQWVVSAVAQRIGAVETARAYFQSLASTANVDDLRRLLNRARACRPNPATRFRRSDARQRRPSLSLLTS